MILHLLIHSKGTEKQFATYVMKQFSASDKFSDFVVMSVDKEITDYDSFHNVRIMNPYNQKNMGSLLKSLANYTAILFHGLFEPWCETILRNVPDNVKVAWEFWGGELYGRRDVYTSFLAPLTRIMNTVHKVYKRSAYYEKWELPIECFQRIDYCLTAQYEEFLFAQNYIPSSHFIHLWYTYYSVEDTVGELIDKQCSGNNVWFCHNATIESNAFDSIIRLVLSPINRKHLKNKSVIMPLSYGGQWIKNIMIKIGQRVFKYGFFPIISFLERDVYNRLMLDCSTMILPSYRPAAQGNIITALWLGMRVYLSERCISYNYFRRIGTRVYSFESDFIKYGCTRLLDEEVRINRQVLSETFGRKHIEDSISVVVAALNGQ